MNSISTINIKFLFVVFFCALFTTSTYAQTNAINNASNGTTITLGGTPIHTVGKLPAVGTMVKDFNLTGVDLKEKSLADFKGKYVIMNIFPKC